MPTQWLKEHRFPDGSSLAHALAAEIKVEIEEAVVERGAASLVVSGGRTPAPLFQSLAREPLARPAHWRHVSITLADERWVAPDSEHSNERLVRTELLVGEAAAARFLPFKNAAATAAEGAAAAWQAVQALPRPFDLVVLGLGDDGHTASLFPGSPGLAAALDRTVQPTCVAMTAPAAPTERLSLNLAALLDARRIVLLITGTQKWQVYLAARAAGPVAQYPVRGVLHQKEVPVEVFHA